MHSRVSGVSDYLARDERHGIELHDKLWLI